MSSEMVFARTALLLVAILSLACAGNPNRRTLAELRRVEPDIAEIPVDGGLDRAMAAYRSFLEQAPPSALTPEAMRRLADLSLEKEYGILGGGGERPDVPAPARAAASERPSAARVAPPAESEAELERRAAGERELAATSPEEELELPGGEEVAWAGPLEAIALYDQILAAYPGYEQSDRILYQKARAYDELGRSDEAIAVIDQLIAEFPGSRFIDEAQFRRGEYYFVRRKYLDAEEAYAAVTRLGPRSDYYELALYKLGWSLYKQELHEEALDQYVALLDHKVASGFDLDVSRDVEGEENDARRIADTFRVISLSFSNLGGPEAVEQYFAARGTRSYEDHVYGHLGEFYLEKRRYHDAAGTYRAFVALHPLHRSAPHFGMRVVDVYEAGGFPKLVLESKKEFAATYGLQAEYWKHFDIAEAPEVRAYLKGNLEDLASHYHALYQEESPEVGADAHFGEALHWYRAYLASFSGDPEAPGLHQRLADLLLEHGDFGEAAREYERTAYGYPAHERAAAAGIAAIYAHRQHQERAEGADAEAGRREVVTSTFRFVDTFPEHEHAAAVLAAAVDDLYAMQDFEQTIVTARRLLADYPAAAPAVRRSAWAAIAHASFDTSDYVRAEHAYGRVLEMTPEEDERRPSVIDNLAAAIYKQGERANLAGDPRAAADHFLRIVEAAPTSAVRPAAEYDAGVALVQLEDWSAAAAVLDTFRRSHPEHELQGEATKQIARIYREQGELASAASEYERIAEAADADELRREALLVAGELYEEAGVAERALAVYRDYLERFPEPLEVAVETRFKVAEIHARAKDAVRRREELRRIVAIDASAGTERTPRIRYLAARSALALTEQLYQRFDEIALVQPFEKHLQEKQRRMDAALDGFADLVDYEVGEVTAAATFYMAEIYFSFSKALMESERPADLAPAELQDYELVLEEEAFPFEERAIGVHEKNLELMTAGVYNAWIEKSLAKLADLMPGRYAKFEASTGPLDSIDRYAYRVPIARGGPVGARGASEAGSADDSSARAEPAPDGART